MSDETTTAEAPAEAPKDEKPQLFFKVTFVDSKNSQVEIETNITDPRQAINELTPVIEHLRRQGVLLELAALQQRQQQSKSGILMPRGLNGGGPSGRKIF